MEDDSFSRSDQPRADKEYLKHLSGRGGKDGGKEFDSKAETSTKKNSTQNQ